MKWWLGDIGCSGTILIVSQKMRRKKDIKKAESKILSAQA